MKTRLSWDEAKRRAGSVFAVQAMKNVRSTMPGSKTNAMKRDEVLAALRALPAEKDFVWDGQDEDERPLGLLEMQAGMAEASVKRGRPVGSGTKQQVAIRFDRDVLAALRATGPGWQTRVNDAMREWVKTHAA